MSKPFPSNGGGKGLYVNHLAYELDNRHFMKIYRN